MSVVPQSTDDIKLETPGLYLFVGAADSGKSFASTSFGLKSKKYGGDDPRPAYLLELDGRISALRGRPVVYNSYTFEDGAAKILERIGELADKAEQQHEVPFHTFILSSFTSFNDIALGESLGLKDEGKGRKRGEITLTTVEDFGYEAECLRKLLYEMLDILKKYCTVIVEAHETEYYKPVKTKPGEPTRTELAGYKILARDKISAKLPTKFDEIYHFLPKEVVVSQRNVRRQVVFQDILARSSYPALQATTVPYDISNKEFYRDIWKPLISGTYNAKS